MAYEPHRTSFLFFPQNGLVKEGSSNQLKPQPQWHLACFGSCWCCSCFHILVSSVPVVPKEATDADFFEVISKLDVRNVHELCALACVTLQRDDGPSNLMLQQGESCLKY